MNHSPLKKAALLMLVIVVAVVASAELYIRSTGLQPAYNDDKALWSHARSRIYEPPATSVVFIGSSRIKYDLDIETWQRLTGKRAVQLAMTGSSPVPVLQDLANDEKFNGNLIIDVTEPLFFLGVPMFNEKPNNRLRYYKEETLAQKANFRINQPLEKQLVFLDIDNFSINAKLAALKVPNRPGIFEMPTFPIGFDRSHFNEQAYMTPQFVADSNEHRKMIDVWKYLNSGPKMPPMPDSTIQAICAGIKTSVDKIKARGGHVFFVRTPSTGDMGFGEKMGFPRERFWEPLLDISSCDGFHFMDNPILAKMICPENSHLTPADAIVYTQELVKVLAGNPILNK